MTNTTTAPYHLLDEARRISKAELTAAMAARAAKRAAEAERHAAHLEQLAIISELDARAKRAAQGGRIRQLMWRIEAAGIVEALERAEARRLAA